MGDKQVKWNHFLTAVSVLIFVIIAVFMLKIVLLQCVITSVLAYLLNPLVNKLERLCVPRKFSVFLVLIIFFGVLVSFFVLVIPIVYSELIALIKFLVNKFPMIQDEMTPSLLSLYKKIGYDNIIDLLNALKNSPETFLTDENIRMIINSLVFASKKLLYLIVKTLSSGSNLSSVLLFLMITPILLFYVLLEWSNIIKGFDGIIPLRYRLEVRKNLLKVDSVISAYIRGQLFVCLIMFFYYGTVLSFMGVNYSILIGFIAGLLTFIPYIGAILSTLIATSIALIQFGSYIKVLFILAFFLSGQAIEGNMLVPFLIGRQVHLHPIWIIVGMTVCSFKMGFIGVVFAIPITAIIGVLTKELIIKYKDSNFYKEIL